MPLGGIGFWELMTVMVVVLLVMGPAKIPEVARTLGKGVRAARRASNELKRAMDIDTYAEPMRKWERDLSISDADVFDEEDEGESTDDIHNEDGTLKENDPVLPGTVARRDPMEDLLTEANPDDTAGADDETESPQPDEGVAGAPAQSSNDA